MEIFLRIITAICLWQFMWRFMARVWVPDKRLNECLKTHNLIYWGGAFAVIVFLHQLLLGVSPPMITYFVGGMSVIDAYIQDLSGSNYYGG